MTDNRVEIDIVNAGDHVGTFNNDEFAFSKALANNVYEICGDRFEAGINASE